MENSEQQKWFIGPSEVLGIESIPGVTTPSGGEVVMVVYGAAKQVMPLKSYEALRTTGPTDYSDLGERKIALIRDEVLKAMLEYDPTAFEVQTILQRVSNKISNVYDRAGHFLFTKEVYGTGADNSWVPGGNFSHYRTLLECDVILKRIGKDDANSQSTSDK